MSTPYSAVFDSFLSKVTDYTFGNLTQEVLERDLVRLMNSAIVDFEYPKVNIRDKDDSIKEFNVNLELDETELLGYLMVDKWMDRQINDLNLFKQRFSTKDFQFTSQANHLDSLIRSQEMLHAKIRGLKQKYSYRKMGSYYNVPDFSGLSSDE